jgi:hypothetical protein
VLATLRVCALADEGRNASKRLGFLPNEESSLIDSQVVETEKVLHGVIRALRDTVAFSLQLKRLSSHENLIDTPKWQA